MGRVPENQIVVINRIKEVLVRKRIKQYEFAKMMGWHVNTISGICTNASQPTLKGLYLIAEKLEVEVSDLLVDKDSVDYDMLRKQSTKDK